ncbi:hypothetical protein NESM_000605600 [Novymonas esmeraldas]|uniref:Uncharacterized protein n=1 Tax=Novymonas esmeraldas TaxID=1808958 RepID=A0AAW0ESH6_9TRYP
MAQSTTSAAAASPGLIRILAEVESDVRRRGVGGVTATTSQVPAPSLLTWEDWAAVRRPLSADAAFGGNAVDEAQRSTSGDPAAAGVDELLRHVQLRCAELPMRLQIEAQQTRRYEHRLHQHTRELVCLSEYVALVHRAPPTLATVAAPSPRGSAESTPDLAALPADLRALLSAAEVTPRLERCRGRIRELESLALQDATAKVRCCQRMVLLSEFVQTLVRHTTARVEALTRGEVKLETSGASAKRPRVEQHV